MNQKLNLFFTDYEEVEIHSRKIFNVRKDRPTTVSSFNTCEDLIGPMVSSVTINFTFLVLGMIHCNDN